MFILFAIGLTSVFGGVILGVIGFQSANVFVFSIGVSGAISGLLFIAIDRALTLLSEIKASLLRREEAEAGTWAKTSETKADGARGLKAAFR